MKNATGAKYKKTTKLKIKQKEEDDELKELYEGFKSEELGTLSGFAIQSDNPNDLERDVESYVLDVIYNFVDTRRDELMENDEDAGEDKLLAEASEMASNYFGVSNNAWSAEDIIMSSEQMRNWLSNTQDSMEKLKKAAKKVHIKKKKENNDDTLEAFLDELMSK